MLNPLENLDRSRSITDQVVDNVMEQVRVGQLKPGERLPSIRAYAKSLGINRNTVAGAFRELAEKGVIESRFGGGSYVSPHATLANSHREPPSERHRSEKEAGVFTEADWELRFAHRLRGFLSRTGKAPFLQQETHQKINLFHLRPNTDSFPLEKFRQCMNTVLRRSGKYLLNYGAPSGYQPLREQIAHRLRSTGLEVDTSQILITSGSQQGIDLMARALLDPDDLVVVESPTYAIALKIFSANGARLISYAITPGGVSFKALEGFHFQQSPKMFYAVPNFQNPTTHSYSIQEKESLLDQVYESGSLLIEDAYYSELHDSPRPSIASLDGLERVVHLNTFSKTMVPAVRVGYLVGPAPLVRKLTEMKEMTDLSHSLILQAAIAEFMERGYFDQHVNTIRQFYSHRMEQVAGLLQKALPEGIGFQNPGGGLFLWLDLPGHLDSDQIARTLRERGVLVCPGSLFQPFPGGRNGLRLCIANESESRLAEGIALVGEVLEQSLRQPAPTEQDREYQATH